MSYGKGEPSVSMARYGSCRIPAVRIGDTSLPLSDFFFSSVLNFLVRTASATLVGIQPKGPIDITPHDGLRIS